MVFRLQSANSRVVPLLIALFATTAVLVSGCERPDPEAAKYTPVPTLIQLSAANQEPPTRTSRPTIPPTATTKPLIADSASYPGTPTPDPIHYVMPTMRGEYAVHLVSSGETLGIIAELYETTAAVLVDINDLDIDALLALGQEILVPPKADVIGPSFKIIPDSELVYGPVAKDFDVFEAASFFGGYLETYREVLEGREMSGPEILQLMADRFSVNPRLLFALLEHQSGWITQPEIADDRYPLGYELNGYEGLYYQLFWAADLVNFGYYGRSEGGMRSFEVGAYTTVDFAPDINDATAGVQLLFGGIPFTSYDKWLHEIGPEGFYTTYSRLFGNPFTYTYDPLWPSSLHLRRLSLPWEPGKTWYFTSGPHGGWASGSAWAALDFAPKEERRGCYQSDAWVTAMSDGKVVRSDHGAVVVDLDGDGFAGTGWAITYMHLDSRERVPLGVEVKEGDRLGHPSCEGGFSNGTHLHIARTYNGRWVSADGEYPFVMDDWTSQGLGREYDGLLVRDDVVKEACNCREEGNAITAD